jgi:hypothetical protein
MTTRVAIFGAMLGFDVEGLKAGAQIALPSDAIPKGLMVRPHPRR